MTRKHFEEAADIVRLSVDKKHKRAVADAFIALFRQFNPSFDKERFERACFESKKDE